MVACAGAGPPQKTAATTSTPRPTTTKSTAGAPPSSSASGVVARPTAPPGLDPERCEPTWPADAAPVAIAWNSCPGDVPWFVWRGFPAVSKDGKSVALAEPDQVPNLGSYNLQLRIVDVDTGKRLAHLPVLGVQEFGEPVAIAQADRATVTARIDAANARLRDLVPLDATPCTAPLPWPTESYGRSAGCTASPSAPAQTVVCATVPEAPTAHVLTLTMKPPRLFATIDGDKSLAIDRDIASWSYAWDSNHTPGGKGKLDSVTPPHLESVSADLGRRVLVLRSGYCNTSDSQPYVPDAFAVFRLPKLRGPKD